MKITLDDHHHKHLHAHCRFKPLSIIDYCFACFDLISAKIIQAATLTFHLPYETQFKSYRNIDKGRAFITFVNFLAKQLKIQTVWENTNILNTNDWSLLENPQFTCQQIPLCFDLGHYILGSKNKQSALKKVDQFWKKNHQYIYHLHLHINDFNKDLHQSDKEKVLKFLGKKRFIKMTTHKTYIFESGS